MNPQVSGMHEIAGTYVFDLRTSNRTLRLNRFLWNMIRAPWRDRFLADADALMDEAGLSDVERSMIHGRDWIGLVRYGANFFVIEKFARVARTTNLQVYASMRGETFEAFMQTRRVPEAR